VIRRLKTIRAPRRRLALLSENGISMLSRHNPYVVMWWAAAFPGFGHLLLHHYIRGIALTISEIVVNSLSHINEAMVYSFCGSFELAKQVIDPTWMYGYLIVYFFSIWDSYRMAREANKQLHLAQMENARIRPFLIGRYCIQFFEKKSPAVAAICAFLFPGLGYLYNHRVDIAFFTIVWWWIYVWKSRVYDAVLALFDGKLYLSNSLLDPHWLLFMPSVVGGAVFHSHFMAVEHNRLFRLEQRQYMTERYQSADLRLLLGTEE
jgi:hypothetical protein